MPRQHVLEPPARWAWSWPSQSTDSTGFTLSPVTLWEQPSVLHRSAQNGTGARKEMCRCSDARAEPCQKNTTNITSSEIKFSTVRRKLTLLDMVHGSTFAPFSQPLVRLKHCLAFPFPSLLWSPVSAAGLRATRSSQKHSQNTWKSEEPHVEI